MYDIKYLLEQYIHNIKNSIFIQLKIPYINDNEDFFSDSDVYSITAFLLKLNNLYDEEVIDKDKLSNIKMPNRNGFILNHH